MGKKRDLANDNIRVLIDMLVEERKSGMRSMCPYQSCKNQGVGCETCKEMYYDKMTEYLEKEFVVV